MHIRSFALAVASLATFAMTVTAKAQQPGAPERMRTLTPGLATYTDQLLFGQVWERPGLSKRDRSIVTVSALIAMVRSAQLRGHLGRALDNDVKATEIAGIITHLAFYSGWPTAASALEVAEEVFKRRGIDPAALQPAKDAKLPLPASDAARAELVARQIGAVAPALAELTNSVLFDDVWRRQDLAPRDRSLVTIAALIATGEAAQLGFHLQRGIENGLSRNEISEAITHLAFYAGWPKAMSAVAAADRIFSASSERPANRDELIVVAGGANRVSGQASNFVGQVHVDTPFQGTGDSRISGGRVTFQAGARTNWHTHPLGQLLIVTDGRGLVQAEGGAIREISPGDVVWIPPGVKHWHGAAPASAMTHFAIAETLNGQRATWLEPVTDAQYQPQQAR